MEKKVWPLPRLFPIKLKNLLLWKVLIPSLIYSLLYLAITIFSIYIFNLNSIILLTIPMISIAFLYSGILAIRFFFKDPTRDISSRNIFRIGEVITIELTTMGIVAGIIAPFTVYTSPIVLQGQYKNIIGIGIPVLVSLIVIYISIKMTKGITEKIDAWE
jgi:ABC-2 type transport system permease protein